MTEPQNPPPHSDTTPPDGTVETISDPRRRFQTPAALMAEPGLSDAEKLAQLQEWEAELADRPEHAAELEAVRDCIMRQAARIGQSD